MRALRGLSKDRTIQLTEIEKYIETGKRPDGAMVTDAWIDDSMKFLVEELRPTLDAWAEMADDRGLEIDILIFARKVYRAWKKGVRGAPLNSKIARLGKAIEKEQKIRLANNAVS